MHPPIFSFFFFFNDTATTEIYTLSLHDALPISNKFTPAGYPNTIDPTETWQLYTGDGHGYPGNGVYVREIDRKSTRLNSSHLVISYAVFCLKKKKNDRRAHWLVRLGMQTVVPAA